MDSFEKFEKALLRIAKWVEEIHPRTPTRGEVQRKYRITKDVLFDMESALMDRRMVVVDPFPSREHGAIVHYRKSEEEWIPNDKVNPKYEGPESVYFALAPSINLMKVGWTEGPVVKRLADINAASPIDVIIFGAIAGRGHSYETELHRRFAKHWVKGEWFTASRIMRDVVLLPGFSPHVEGMNELQVARRVVSLADMRRRGNA
jgi:hypothetical protein